MIEQVLEEQFEDYVNIVDLVNDLVNSDESVCGNIAETNATDWGYDSHEFKSLTLFEDHVYAHASTLVSRDGLR